MLASSTDPVVVIFVLLFAGGFTALCLTPAFRRRRRELRWLRSLAWPGADAEGLARLEAFRRGAISKVRWEVAGLVLLAFWLAPVALLGGVLCLAYSSGSTRRLRVLAAGLGLDAGEWRGLARREGSG